MGLKKDNGVYYLPTQASSFDIEDFKRQIWLCSKTHNPYSYLDIFFENASYFKEQQTPYNT